MIISDLLFREKLNITSRRIEKPKPLTKIARANIKLDEKELNKQTAKKVNNPYYFTDRILKIAFNITI